MEEKCAENKTISENKGELMLDATCCPSDVRFPTDRGRLRKFFLNISKSKRNSRNKIKKTSSSGSPN